MFFSFNSSNLYLPTACPGNWSGTSERNRFKPCNTFISRLGGIIFLHICYNNKNKKVPHFKPTSFAEIFPNTTLSRSLLFKLNDIKMTTWYLTKTWTTYWNCIQSCSMTLSWIIPRENSTVKVFPLLYLFQIRRKKMVFGVIYFFNNTSCKSWNYARTKPPTCRLVPSLSIPTCVRNLKLKISRRASCQRQMLAITFWALRKKYILESRHVFQAICTEK